MLARLLRVLRLLNVLAGGHRTLALENLALRQQLAMYRRARPRPTVIYVGDAKNLNKRPLTNPHHVVVPHQLEILGADALNFLYVSIGPLYVIDPDAKRYAYQRAYSTYVENKLAWDYAKLHGHPPLLS